VQQRIGKSIAMRFAQEGATVAIADLDMKAAASAVAEIAHRGGVPSRLEWT